jgi:hypothetical protein
MNDNRDRFVLTGLLERVEADDRRLCIGGRDVRVASHVGLDALAPGTRVVVSGRREGPTGQPLAERIFLPLGPPSVRPLPTEGDPDHTEAREADGSRILELVVSLLIELRLDAQVLECALLPPNDLYAVRIQIPQEGAKAILVPRRVLERAFVDPVALRTARALLRSAVETLRNPRSISDTRLAWYTTGAHASWSGSRCARCEGPLFAHDPLVVQDDVRWHMACPPTW